MLFALKAQGSMAVEDQIAPALSAAGLSTATARFDENMFALFRSGEFTTPLYTAASRDPWKAPFFFDVFTRDLEAQAGKPNEILNIGTRYVGTGSRRTLIGDPLAKFRLGPEANVNMAFYSITRSAKSGDHRENPSDHPEVPREVKQAAILILRAIEQARGPYELFFDSAMGASISNPKPPNELQIEVANGLKDDSTSADFAKALAIFHRADTRYLMAGAHDIALAVQDASKMIADVPPNLDYQFTAHTIYGLVSLSGGASSTYRDSEPYALIIDTGGDDTYINAPSANGQDSWTSIAIDTSGNDKYLSDPALAGQDVASFKERKNPGVQTGPGGAFMGYSFLFDLRGDDLYRSHRCGLASGRLGVAVLEDMSGNDTYDGYADSIGFGMFGAGILEDIEGNDTYSGFTQVEAVGQTAGFGALIDRAGNDTYVSNDTVIDFPSAQSDKHNNSMSQGAGNGTRRDYIDAHTLAGGIGVLLDLGGDDKYSGAVFAQGVGYWEGIGILRDKAGRDTYNAGWYAQGASAHFAIGFLQDDAGDDHYTATMNMAQGAGHDFGAGYLLDLSGNDTYVAPNLSLGGGNANGIGLLLDVLGDDNYTSSGITLGQSGDAPAGSLRTRALTLGVFCDLAGKDTYPATITWAKNGGTQVNWIGKARVPEESQLGVFFDR
jgi:hypothetical protein